MILLKLFTAALFAGALFTLPPTQGLTLPATGLTTLSGTPLYALPDGTSAL